MHSTGRIETESSASRLRHTESFFSLIAIDCSVRINLHLPFLQCTDCIPLSVVQREVSNNEIMSVILNVLHCSCACPNLVSRAPVAVHVRFAAVHSASGISSNTHRLHFCLG